MLDSSFHLLNHYRINFYWINFAGFIFAIPYIDREIAKIKTQRKFPAIRYLLSSVNSCLSTLYPLGPPMNGLPSTVAEGITHEYAGLGHILPPTTLWIASDSLTVPYGTCICSNVETIHSWTCHVYGPFEFRISLGNSILLLTSMKLQKTS